tara:strand:+ start:382 stop:1245 length:864 start_codon:yes stop_codon:yes gene_type:complete
MSIDTPESGQQISSSSITEMHDGVTEKINNIKSDNLGRGSIGPQHLGKTTSGVSQNSLVMGSSEVTLSSPVYLAGLVGAYHSSNSTRGLDYNSTIINGGVGSLYYEVNTNWTTLLTIPMGALTYEVSNKTEQVLIISFDSRIDHFADTDNSNAKYPAGTQGMVWYGIIVEKTRTAGGSGSVSNEHNVIEESVVGCHLLDSNKFINASNAQTDRYGGINQSISNTCMFKLEHLSAGDKHTITNIKLCAAFTTAIAGNVASSATRFRPLIRNTTLRYYSLIQSKLPLLY